MTQPKPEPRGFFEAIGRWFDEGTAGFRSHVAGAKTSIDEFNQRAEETRKSIGNSAAEISKNAVGAGVAAADVTRMRWARWPSCRWLVSCKAASAA